MLCKDKLHSCCQCNIFRKIKIFILLSLLFQYNHTYTHTPKKKTPNTCSSLDKQEFYFILSLVHIDSNVNYYACGVQRLKFDPFILGHGEVAFVVRMKLVPWEIICHRNTGIISRVMFLSLQIGLLNSSLKKRVYKIEFNSTYNVILM